MSALRIARWSAVTALTLGCAARHRAPAPVAVANAATPDTAQAAPDTPVEPTPVEPTPAAPRTPRVAARLAPCTPQRGAHAVPPANTPVGDPAARAAAQRGLAFVSREAVRWQTQHNCYGCHVQAVTFEALTVGREHRYDIADSDFRTVMRGLLDVPGGHRQPGGLSVGGSGEPTTSRTFGGAAFARYDASQGGELTDDLLAVAGQLQEAQQTDGHLQNDDTRFPVVEGPMQATTQALQTWRQAWARSADARWLAPMRRAEAWVQARARALSDDPSAGTVPLNYAVMGLLAAGAQPSEAALTALAAQLRRRQLEDGGWSYQPTGESNAFATGQTLHALRSLGASDDNAVVARGTRWLIAHQQEDGGWSRGGSGKAEAMWAVFGLVSIDVMSASLEGLRDGEHVDGDRTLTGRAVDNNGAPVQQVDLLVDDVPVARACGSAVTWRLDSASLQPGVHTVDLVGTNARGQTTRRRVEVYAGAHYLVRAATQWRNGATEINLRNVAPAARWAACGCSYAPSVRAPLPCGRTPNPPPRAPSSSPGAAATPQAPRSPRGATWRRSPCSTPRAVRSTAWSPLRARRHRRPRRALRPGDRAASGRRRPGRGQRRGRARRRLGPRRAAHHEQRGRQLALPRR